MYHSESYMLLSSDVEVNLSDFTITLSRNDKIYPKTEKINTCRPEFENFLFDRSRSMKPVVISYTFS